MFSVPRLELEPWSKIGAPMLAEGVDMEVHVFCPTAATARTRGRCVIESRTFVCMGAIALREAHPPSPQDNRSAEA